jgi:hypothetical protein
VVGTEVGEGCSWRFFLMRPCEVEPFDKNLGKLRCRGKREKDGEDGGEDGGWKKKSVRRR